MKRINLQRTGNRIRQFMNNRGIGHYELSIKMVVRPQTIYKWTSGKGMPSIDSLVNLSSILKVGIEDILVIEDV